MIPALVRDELLAPAKIQSIVPLSPGLSGASIFKCRGIASCVLRCWPNGTDLERVRWIHQIISAAATRTELVPRYWSTTRGNTFCTDTAGCVWELVDCIEGQPLAYDAPLEMIVGGAKAIQEVHEAMRLNPQSSNDFVNQPSRAISLRLRRCNEIDGWLPDLIHATRQRSHPGWDSNVHPEVAEVISDTEKLLGRRWHSVSANIQEALSPYRSIEFATHYVLRDIHRENALFSGGNIQGIVDFDAISVDFPPIDLARWSASFSAFEQEPQSTVESVLAGYQWHGPLPNGMGMADLVRLIEDIAECSSWISLVNWVEWLVIESRPFPDYQRIAARLRRLIDSRRASRF